MLCVSCTGIVRVELVPIFQSEIPLSEILLVLQACLGQRMTPGLTFVMVNTSKAEEKGEKRGGDVV